MSGTETPDSFTLEMIPQDGYELGNTESLPLDIGFTDETPDGRWNFFGAYVPYKNAVGIRTGSNEDHVDFRVIAIPVAGGSFTDRTHWYFIYPEGQYTASDIALPVEHVGGNVQGSVHEIGRGNPLYTDLPALVDDTHFSLRQLEGGTLQIENLQPAGNTILLRTDSLGGAGPMDRLTTEA